MIWPQYDECVRRVDLFTLFIYFLRLKLHSIVNAQCPRCNEPSVVPWSTKKAIPLYCCHLVFLHFRCRVNICHIAYVLLEIFEFCFELPISWTYTG